MVKDYLPLLKYKAAIAHRRVQYKIPVPFEDCLGEAYVIFCTALVKYDPTRGAEFKTYLYDQLRNLEKKILIANRMSSIDSFKYMHPASHSDKMPTKLSGFDEFDVAYEENLCDRHVRIPIEELSKDGSLIVSLLLNGVIGDDYGSGRGKKLPGKKRIPPYMKKHFHWSYRKTETVIEEIKDWWRDQL